MRKINQAGLELVKSFEGLRLAAYQDSVGVWTIGYGSTTGVKRGQRITEEEAEDLLRKDLATAEAGVESAITEDITDNQFAACVSLAFNVGVGAFRKSSIVKYINAGDIVLAADRFLLYNRAGGKVLAGLTRRRKAERALFLTDDEPIQNGEVTEPATGAESTEIVKTTVVQETASGTKTEETSLVSKITGNEQLKTIASEGVTKLATKATTALTAGSTASATGGSITGKTWLIILSVVMAVGAIAIVIFLLWHKSRKENQAAVINSDKDRADVVFAKK